MNRQTHTADRGLDPAVELSWQIKRLEAQRNRRFAGNAKIPYALSYDKQRGYDYTFLPFPNHNDKQVHQAVQSVTRGNHTSQVIWLPDHRTVVKSFLLGEQDERGQLDAYLDRLRVAGFDPDVIQPTVGATEVTVPSKHLCKLALLEKATPSQWSDAGMTADGRRAWLECSVDPYQVDAIQAQGGMKSIRWCVDTQMSLQDMLDATLQTRLIQVRNALRDLGWDGARGETLSKQMGSSKCSISNTFDVIGAGANLVGIHYDIRFPGQVASMQVFDFVDASAEDFAQKLLEMAEAKLLVAKTQGKAPQSVEQAIRLWDRAAQAPENQSLDDRMLVLDRADRAVVNGATGIGLVQPEPGLPGIHLLTNESAAGLIRYLESNCPEGIPYRAVDYQTFCAEKATELRKSIAPTVRDVFPDTEPEYPSLG